MHVPRFVFAVVLTNMLRTEIAMVHRLTHAVAQSAQHRCIYIDKRVTDLVLDKIFEKLIKCVITGQETFILTPNFKQAS